MARTWGVLFVHEIKAMYKEMKDAHVVWAERRCMTGGVWLQGAEAGALDGYLDTVLPVLEADLFGDIAEAKEADAFAAKYRCAVVTMPSPKTLLQQLVLQPFVLLRQRVLAL